MQDRNTHGQRYQMPQTKPVKKKPAKTKPVHWLWIGLGLTGVAMVSATAGALLAVSLASTPLLQQKLTPEEEAVFNNGDSFSNSHMRLPAVTRPVNILVLGMSVLPNDVRDAPTATKNLGFKPQVDSVEGLSDTMMLMRFNPETKKVVVLSIPRDTRIVMEKHGVQKINAANALGGPALAATEVSRLLDNAEIDRYVRINVLGVGKLIDALGGLNIYVPKDMKYTDESQHLFVNLKKGWQHLNGDQAMQLLRFRNDSSGDMGRIQRQQLVIRALMEQALNPTTIAHIPKLLSLLQSHIDTNLSIEELMALVGFASKIDKANVQGLIVPGDFNGNGRHEVSYWLPNSRHIKQLMAKYFDQGHSDKEVVEPNRIRVSVQNGSQDPQAVPSLVKKLRLAGYHNVSIGDRLPEPLGVTQIVAQQGDADSAQAVYQSLGFGDVRVDTSGVLYSDVTIKLGQDWLQKNETVDTSIKP